MKSNFLLLTTLALSTFISNTTYALSCHQEANEIIKSYNLQPNDAEGGYFKLTYKLDDTSSDIPKSTAIYYFLKNEDHSLMHKLSNDIIYHFYAGDPVTMVLLKPDGSESTVTLGNDVLHQQQPQVVIPKNTWIGSYIAQGGCYALMGTTMTPGFDPKGYELGDRATLIDSYPEYKSEIVSLTK